jgi:DNA-binding IclR family transcriptional regulator
MSAASAPVAIIGISGPKARMGPKEITRKAEMVVDCARRISSQFGFPRTDAPGR